MRYAFIRAQSEAFPVRHLCQWLEVHPSGYYPWQNKPRSARARTNDRLTGLIKPFWLESGGVYGYRKIYSHLREYGESCSQNRVHRLMQAAGLKAQVGYQRPRHRGGKASIVAPNHLQRAFNVETPNEAWATSLPISAPMRARYI